MTTSEFLSWLTNFTPAARGRPLVMGVLNVTPDSFSDGGQFLDADAAVDRALAMVGEGADLIDVGGESTRPGSLPVPSAVQIERVAPVIAAVRQRVDVAISIDTTAAPVAEAALNDGAVLINDISAGRDDPAMLPLAAARSAPIVLMHMKGTPQTMQQNPTYADVVDEVSEFLAQRRAAAEAAGVAPSHILLDPGIGFGKTVDHNLRLLAELPRLAALGRPLLVGTSRKGFISKVLGRSDETARLFGTAATVAWSLTAGAAIVRVHDVAGIAPLVRMLQAIRSASA